MRKTHSISRGSILLWIGVVGILFACALANSTAYAQTGSTSQGIPAENEVCLACHSSPGQTMTLPNGDVLNIAMEKDMLAASVHGGLPCQACHTNITGFPHPELNVLTAQEYTLTYKESCVQCHSEISSAEMDGAHAKILAEGNTNAPTCANCHDPHTATAIQKDTNGHLIPAEHAKSALVCANCHSTIYDEYAKSVHGASVVSDGNIDSPSCIDCHGVHKTAGPNSVSDFRLTSPLICAKCHTDAALMGKYNLSTDVLDSYIADFHGTTVQIFAKTDPDQQINMPVCIDCHGVHDILSTKDPEHGLQIKQNVLVSCQKCHPDASDNFPDSWLNHYNPSPTKYPLVYYVNLAYTILIPLVLGVMAIYVGSDIYARLRNKGKKNEPVIDEKASAPQNVEKKSDSEEAKNG